MGIKTEWEAEDPIWAQRWNFVSFYDCRHITSGNARLWKGLSVRLDRWDSEAYCCLRKGGRVAGSEGGLA